MAKKIDIGGELHSVATDHKVADASEIKDISKGNKSQTAFNNDVDRHEVEIHGTGGIDSRVTDLEAMEQIVIDGGEAQIAQGSDFTNPDATKRAKIPTVGAVVDGLNDGVYDVSKRNPTAGPNSDGKFTLDYILDNANTLIPTGWRHGGMTISFVQSSDNKYVQYRLMLSTFTDAQFVNAANWQGVDDEPTVGSLNLVKSGGIAIEQIKTHAQIYKGSIYNISIDSQGQFVSNSDCELLVYKIDAHDIITIKRNTYKGSLIAFLKSISNLYVGSSADYCTGESRRLIASFDEQTISLPSDCVYLIVWKTYNGDNYMPDKLYVDGNDISIDISNMKLYIDEKIEEEKQRSENADNNLSDRIATLTTAVNPIVEAVEELDWERKPVIYKFNQSDNSKATLYNNIVLSHNGDSIEFILNACSYKNFGERKGYAFAKNPNNASFIAIGVTRESLSLRADDSTWIFLASEFGSSAVGKSIKISYENDVINAYVNNNVIATYNSQKAVTISSFGDGSIYGYWDGEISELKINGNNIELSAISILSNVEIITPPRSFLNSDEQAELKNASLPLMMVEKSTDKIIIYKKLEGNRYIAYPLEHRELSYTAGQYPSFEDNWGIWKPYVAEFSNNAMSMVLDIFNSGEAELALNVPRGDSVSGNAYVGGGAHGFEVINETDAREFALLIDNIKHNEDSVIPLQKASSVLIQQGTNLYQAYTNTNPFVYALKKWVFSENENLQITTKVKILRSIQIVNGQFGMFCVYRHSEGVAQNDYLTDRAIKDNNPFTTYNIEDGWDSISANTPLRRPDYDCKKITEYGQIGLGFAMSIKDANTKESGGMFVTTNNSVYNKIYFSLCNNYNAATDEVLYATQEWSIEGSYTES